MASSSSGDHAASNEEIDAKITATSSELDSETGNPNEKPLNDLNQGGKSGLEAEGSPDATISADSEARGTEAADGKNGAMEVADPEVPEPSAEEEKERCPSRSDPVSFRVIYNKAKYEVDFFLDETIGNLKKHLENIISVPAAMQKIMVKGLAKDDRTLRELGVSSASKVMVVGSTFTDVLAVSQPAPKKPTGSEDQSATLSKEPLCEQKLHKKVISAGPPDDVMPGIKNAKDPLPQMPLTGMVNKHGGRVRLTFKLEVDQIWFGTKERTEKVNMSSVKTIVTEPIVGHEQYHIMGFQLGSTEASRYWVYWVPAQYVDSIKDTVLGSFQYF